MRERKRHPARRIPNLSRRTVPPKQFEKKKFSKKKQVQKKKLKKKFEKKKFEKKEKFERKNFAKKFRYPPAWVSPLQPGLGYTPQLRWGTPLPPSQDWGTPPARTGAPP